MYRPKLLVNFLLDSKCGLLDFCEKALADLNSGLRLLLKELATDLPPLTIGKSLPAAKHSKVVHLLEA